MAKKRGFDGEEERWIAPSKVQRDPTVNRFFEEPRAAGFVKKGFDPKRARSAGYVVSERSDGTLIWLDGQHRGAAAILAGWGGVPVHMTVLTGLSRKEEAEWVLLFQEDRKGTPPAEAHRLGVKAKRRADLALHSVCLKYGIEASGSGGENKLAAVGTARKIAARENGAELLDHSFDVLTGAFGSHSDSFEAALLNGMAHFWNSNNGNVDKSSLVKKLNKRFGTGPTVIAAAKNLQLATGRPLYREVASIVVGAYNKGRRSGALDLM
jgi:hypothetical protein